MTESDVDALVTAAVRHGGRGWRPERTDSDEVEG